MLPATSCILLFKPRENVFAKGDAFRATDLETPLHLAGSAYSKKLHLSLTQFYTDILHLKFKAVNYLWANTFHGRAIFKGFVNIYYIMQHLQQA